MQKPLTNADEKQGPQSERQPCKTWSKEALSLQRARFLQHEEKERPLGSRCRPPSLTAMLRTGQGLSQLVVRGAGRTAKWPPGLSEEGSGAALSGSSFSLSLCALREHLSCRATSELSKPGPRMKLSHFWPVQASSRPRGACTVIHLGVERKVQNSHLFSY